MYRRQPRSLTPFVFVLFIFIFILGFIMNTGEISFDFRSRARFVPANITVDAAVVGQPVNLSFYHAFAQGGEEAKNMLAGLEAKIAQYRPIIIRLDHIYDYYHVVTRGSSGLVFRFEELDEAIASIRKTGAVPLLSLSYMPAAIAQSGSIINGPATWEEWAFVVQKTIEHVSASIPNVYYEVWNEPDHPQFGGWKPYGSKNYLTLYHYAALGASRARNIQPYKLGGPSVTALYKNWMDALLKSGDRVDFLSWHTYAIDPTQYKKEMENIQNWISALNLPVRPELLITEFGFNSAKDSRYHTYFAAAHMAAVVRSLLDAPPKYVFSFEIKDGPNDSGSGWGMWTFGGNPKPRLAVFPMMDSMRGSRLSLRGEGSRVSAFATTDGTVYRIFLVNFDPSGGSEAFPLSVINLPNGSYDVTYRRMVGPTQTTRETIEEGMMWQKQIILSASNVMILEFLKR